MYIYIYTHCTYYILYRVSFEVGHSRYQFDYLKSAPFVSLQFSRYEVQSPMKSLSIQWGIHGEFMGIHFVRCCFI